MEPADLGDALSHLLLPATAWPIRILCTALRMIIFTFPGENARRWGALGEARPGQSSLSAGP